MKEGLIRDPKQITQAIEFNLSSGNIHPTDIDAVLEFDNDILILFEVKKVGNNLPYGQRLLLERIVNSWGGRYAVALFCHHTVFNADKPILLNECIIQEVYQGKEWKQHKEQVETAIKRIANIFNIEKLSQLR